MKRPRSELFTPLGDRDDRVLTEFRDRDGRPVSRFDVAAAVAGKPVNLPPRVDSPHPSEQVGSWSNDETLQHLLHGVLVGPTSKFIGGGA